MSSPDGRHARRRLAPIAAALVPLGLATKAYGGPGAGWVQGHLGGVLYVTFWIVVVLLVRPELKAVPVAWAVLGVTCALETLQLWHPPFLEAARTTFLGQALLGAHFSWWDFPHYLVGAVGGVVIARWAEDGG